MVRMQIYLTEEQRAAVAAIADHSGKRQSEVIREAVDRFIEQKSRGRREAILREAAGIWGVTERISRPSTRCVADGTGTEPCRNRSRSTPTY